MVLNFTGKASIGLFVIPLALVCACGGGRSSVADAGERSGDAQTTDAAPFVDATGRDAGVCHSKVDVLLVLDASESMISSNQRFFDSVPSLTSAIATSADARIAVTTVHTNFEVTIDNAEPFPDVVSSFAGDDGLFLVGDCLEDSNWLDLSSPEAASDLECMARFAVDEAHGGYEMPLEAIDRATHDRVADATNAGFFRDDALLLVLVLTDEDDCSSNNEQETVPSGTPPCESFGQNLSSYVTSLDSLKGSRAAWSTLVIYGGAGGCSNDLHEAMAAPRLSEFASLGTPSVATRLVCGSESQWLDGLSVALATGCSP